MTNPLAQDLGGVVRLLNETSGQRWVAEGTCVVHDPDHGVYRGHVADCVEDDDAAFIAACHEFFRTHSAEIAGALRDAERYRWLRAEHAVRSPLAHVCWKRNDDRECGDWVNTPGPDQLDTAIDSAMQQGGGGE